MCDIDPVSLASSSAETARAQTLAADLRAIFRKLKQSVRGHGLGNGLTPAQISVIFRLEGSGAATVSSLARAEGMRPQSMSAIVAPLQETGLIRGAPDPGDGRQTLMSLTPKGQGWIEEGRAARQDWLATTISRKLSANEQQQLQAALQLVARLVEA